MSAPIAYVLSTRALSAQLIEEAAAKGITIDVVPFIGTAKLHDETLAKQLGKLAGQPLTAIFTSSNAVMAIENAKTPGWKIFCINGATRHAAAERFGEQAIAGVAGSAAELAELIISRGSSGENETSAEGGTPGESESPAEGGTPGECWFFCGDKRREELPERLKAAGWQVHEVVVYQTTLTPQRMEKSYDAVIFFSPSAVESFFSMNTIGPRVRLFAIGKTTAAEIRAKCPNPVSISEKPDETILIRQLLERLAATRPKDKH